MTGVLRSFGCINESQIDYFDTGAGKPGADPLHVFLKTGFEIGKLGPIGVQSDSAKTDAEWLLARD